MTHIAITGASSGIGHALALHRAAAGTTLSLVGRDRDRLDAVAADATAAGTTVKTALIDVRDGAALGDWLLARDATLPIDTVIACAGIGGVAHTVAPLVPRFMARGRGRLILVGSMVGAVGLPHSPAYCASKAAVRVYGDGLRRLLRPRGVTVTVAMPGYVETPMSQSLPLGRPILWTAEKVAARIVRDAERGARYSHPPLPMRLLIGLAGWVPVTLLDAILTRAFVSDTRLRASVDKSASGK
jgi:short-subunit dehydrogenase